jgi:hypothetical protein
VIRLGSWLASVTSGLTSKSDPAPVIPITTKPATCAHCGRDDVRVLVTHRGTVFCSPECRWYFDDAGRA